MSEGLSPGGAHEVKLSVKEATSELIKMGKKHPLSGRELQHAKLLMIFLRTQGYTNRQISYSTRGTWSESTVKLYTRGTGKKRRIGSLATVLPPLLQGRITVGDIFQCKYLADQFSLHHITIDDAISVVEAASKYGMDLGNVLVQYHNLGVSGLREDEIYDILQIRREMEENDLSSKDLAEILKACAAHGGKDRFMAHIRSLKSGT